MSRSYYKEILVQLRSEIIADHKLLPYTVYTDNTLEDLLDASPKSIEELIKVKGFPVNGVRVKVFGNLIVDVFNNKYPNGETKSAQIDEEDLKQLSKLTVFD